MLYHNWQKHGTPPGPPYNGASPNLKQLLAYAIAKFGGSNLGIYVVRPVTGGTSWSSHAYGAANDWGYTVNGKADRALALRYIDFLIVNHVALHVQMIVDEAYDRTWKCWRDELNGPGWKAGKVTGGGNWLHIETTPDGWADASAITGRLIAVEPPPPEPPPDPVPPTPTVEVDMIALDWNPDSPDWTALCWTGTELAHTFNGHADAVLRRASVKRVTVNDDELLGIIQSSHTTTEPPHTLTPAMLAAWD